MYWVSNTGSFLPRFPIIYITVRLFLVNFNPSKSWPIIDSIDFILICRAWWQFIELLPIIPEKSTQFFVSGNELYWFKNSNDLLDLQPLLQTYNLLNQHIDQMCKKKLHKNFPFTNIHSFHCQYKFSYEDFTHSTSMCQFTLSLYIPH